MKLFSSLALSSMVTLSVLNAQTTMCYKENHKNMTTIETTALNGGECKGINSVEDMKNSGWQVEDINIQKTEKGNNYIYIFKKQSISSVDEKELENRILQKLEKRKEKEVLIKKERIYAQKSKSGEALYKSKCISCHGKNGEEKARGTSRPLRDLSLQDFTLSIRDYNVGDYDRGMAFVMRPYATLLSKEDVKNVYVYIQSLKKSKQENK